MFCAHVCMLNTMNCLVGEIEGLHGHAAAARRRLLDEASVTKNNATGDASIKPSMGVMVASQSSPPFLSQAPKSNELLNAPPLSLSHMSNVLDDFSSRILFAIPKKGRLFRKCDAILKGASLEYTR